MDKKDFERFEYSAGCEGCVTLNFGLNKHVHHSEACRARLAGLLEQGDDIDKRRVERNKERMKAHKDKASEERGGGGDDQAAEEEGKSSASASGSQRPDQAPRQKVLDKLKVLKVLKVAKRLERLTKRRTKRRI